MKKILKIAWEEGPISWPVIAVFLIFVGWNKITGKKIESF